MMGMGEKPRNIYRNKRKNPPFGCPPIPPSIKLEADCFPGRKEPKTSRTYPRWGRDPNLFFQGSAAALVPFVAGSHRLLPALLSTKPLPAVFG